MISFALAAALLFTQDAPQRIRVGGNVQAMNLVQKVTPVYPPMAKQARIQGTVRFTAVISREGDIVNLQVVSGHPLLVPSATEAVKQWKYKPTLLNGAPVEVITQIDVNYTLSADFAWAVNWTFLERYRVAGEGRPTAKQAMMLSDGSLRSPVPGIEAWKFRPLTLDGGEPFAPTVFMVDRIAGMPDIIGGWKVMQPRILSRRDPVKPRPELTGTVTVDCIVDAEGKVQQILNATGNAELVDAAREAVKDWRFRPVAINGESQTVRAYVEVEF